MKSILGLALFHRYFYSLRMAFHNVDASRKIVGAPHASAVHAVRLD